MLAAMEERRGDRVMLCSRGATRDGARPSRFVGAHLQASLGQVSSAAHSPVVLSAATA